MLEVEVHNFQSISREVVQLEGFTALVGRSNIGKSAVVRAVKAAITGAPVDTYVRHNHSTCDRTLKGNKKCKCFCRVRMESPEFRLVWEKGDAVNRYEFGVGAEQQEYTVVGKGIPEFLEDGFLPVKVGDSKELLQISDQFKPIFLLDESGGVVADVLSDVARLDHINKATGLVEKDRKEASSKVKLRKQDADTLQTKVDSFEGLEGTLKMVADVGQQEQQVNIAQGKADQLVEFAADVRDLALQVRALMSVEKIEIPACGEVVQKGQAFDRLGNYIAKVESKAAVVEALDGVEDVEIVSLAPLAEKKQAYDSLTSWLEVFRRYKVMLTSLRGVEDIELPPDYENLWEKFDRFQVVIGYLHNATTTRDAWRKLEADMAKADEELAVIKAKIDKLGSVCPTCKQPILAGHDDHEAA